MTKDSVLLQKLPVPKGMQLPNGQVFFSKYQRVGSDRLPECVRIRRTYVRKIGPYDKELEE